jgi:ribosomal-protein-alanine N-acetyltransferase
MTAPQYPHMTLTFSPMDRISALEIVQWRYPPPYDLYNLSEDEETIAYALDPANSLFAMRDANAQMVGFCSFGVDGQVPGGDYSQGALDIGMGIHPQLTGQGNGVAYAQQVLAYARQAYASVRFRVTIAVFNQRAQRVWTRCGFHPVQRFQNPDSNREFVVMVSA